MDLINSLVLASFAVNLFLALFIHFRSQKNTANLLFGLAAFAVAFWCLSMFFYRLADSQTVELWARILYFAASFTSPLFLLFGLYFVQSVVRERLVVVIFTLTILVALLSIYPGAIIERVVLVPGRENFIVFGWAYPLYYFHIAGLFTAFYGVFFYKYFKIRRTNLLLKTQIQYVLVGTLLVSFLAMLTNLTLPTLGYFGLNWLGQVLAAVWVGFITYAIVKHRWLDIHLVVARAVAYSLLLLIFAGSYTVALFIVGAYFFPFNYDQGQFVASAFLALILALSFQPLRRVLEKATDSIFYKEGYNSHKLLASLGQIMAQTLLLSELTQRILDKILSEMRLAKGGFILVKNQAIFDQEMIGFKPEPVFKKEDVEILMTKNEILIFEELKEEKLKGWMRHWGLTVVIPLQTKEAQIGFLILGEKASGDIYSSEDLKVLEILTPELTVAIQNAEAYEEIRRFNITLKEEVEKATRDLRQANKKLKELDKLKDEFLSVASHELRTPMTNIKNYIWMALHKSDQALSQNLRKYLERAFASASRLISLVNDMLDVSHLEQGKIEINQTPLDIVALANDVASGFAAQIQGKEIDLKIARTGRIPKVMGDSEKVYEIFINLIGNACKFTSLGGKVKVGFVLKDGMVETSISDTGIGIKKTNIPRLFQKFGRLDNSYTAAAENAGTGLGLYICKLLVELQRGQIWATSQGEGRGAAFTFSLPVAANS